MITKASLLIVMTLNCPKLLTIIFHLLSDMAFNKQRSNTFWHSPEEPWSPLRTWDGENAIIINAIDL